MPIIKKFIAYSIYFTFCISHISEMENSLFTIFIKTLNIQSQFGINLLTVMLFTYEADSFHCNYSDLCHGHFYIIIKRLAFGICQYSI